MTEEERRQNILKIFDIRREVFIKKNKDYGSAYILAGKLFEMIFPNGIELKTWNDHCAYQVMTRKMDKIARFCNLRFTNKKKAEVAESIADTLGDDGIYSFMLEELEKTSNDEKDSTFEMRLAKAEDLMLPPKNFEHLVKCRCPRCTGKKDSSPYEQIDTNYDGLEDPK